MKKVQYEKKYGSKERTTSKDNQKIPQNNGLQKEERKKQDKLKKLIHLCGSNYLNFLTP